MTDKTDDSLQLPQIITDCEHLIRQYTGACCRYMGTRCSKTSCMLRGGHKTGDPVDYERATCLEHETIMVLSAVAALRNTLAYVDGENEKLRDHIRLLLPLAKGYAHENQRCVNNEIIAHAESAIRKDDEWSRRPSGSNADEWAIFLETYQDEPEFVAVQIAEAIDAARGTKQEAVTRVIEPSPSFGEQEGLTGSPEYNDQGESNGQR